MNRLNNWFIKIKHINCDDIIQSDEIYTGLSNSDGTPDGHCYGCGYNANDARGHGHYDSNTFKGFEYGCGNADDRGFSDGSSY